LPDHEWLHDPMASELTHKKPAHTRNVPAVGYAIVSPSQPTNSAILHTQTDTLPRIFFLAESTVQPQQLQAPLVSSQCRVGGSRHPNSLTGCVVGPELVGDLDPTTVLNQHAPPNRLINKRFFFHSGIKLNCIRTLRSTLFLYVNNSKKQRSRKNKSNLFTQS
jgi:hypothetical protein